MKKLRHCHPMYILRQWRRTFLLPGKVNRHVRIYWYHYGQVRRWVAVVAWSARGRHSRTSSTLFFAAPA